MCIILNELYVVRVNSIIRGVESMSDILGVESMSDIFMLKQFIVFEGKFC